MLPVVPRTKQIKEDSPKIVSQVLVSDIRETSKRAKNVGVLAKREEIKNNEVTITALYC